MPPKRRVTGPRTASQRQQSTLSFAGKNSRVTKASSPRSAKSKKDPALLDDAIKVEQDSVLNEPTTTEIAIREQAKEEAETLDSVPDPLSTGVEVKTEDVLGGRAQESDVGAVGGLGSGWVGNEEAEARKVSQSHINKYWKAKEQERKAPRVHQQDLTVHEKILREWDMSGQFGPCIGIARLKRWKRANMLGLNPPIEVLAVMLKEMDGPDSARLQMAYVDELMNSRYAET